MPRSLRQKLVDDTAVKCLLYYLSSVKIIRAVGFHDIGLTYVGSQFETATNYDDRAGSAYLAQHLALVAYRFSARRKVKMNNKDILKKWSNKDTDSFFKQFLPWGKVLFSELLYGAISRQSKRLVHSLNIFF